MASKAKAKKVTAKKINGKKPAATKSNKTARVIALMQRSGGTTREAVLKATGWPSICRQLRKGQTSN
jgi:hypothetical protein